MPFDPTETLHELVKETPPQHVIDFAVEQASCSPCQSQRGAVIFDGDDILGHGYNFKPRGFDCDGSDDCKATCRVEAIHAEQMALLMPSNTRVRGADLLHVKAVNYKLVPSGGPSCVQCGKLALVSGIAGVWLYHADGWRRYEAAEFHRLSLEALRVPARPEEPEKVIERVIQNVAELPDRTSPDDWPEAMLVTAEELRAILEEAMCLPVRPEGQPAARPEEPGLTYDELKARARDYVIENKTSDGKGLNDSWFTLHASGAICWMAEFAYALLNEGPIDRTRPMKQWRVTLVTPPCRCR